MAHTTKTTKIDPAKPLNDAQTCGALSQTTDFEAEAFRLEMENKRLRGWLEHIFQMRDRPSVDLREAASFALAGDPL